MLCNTDNIKNVFERLKSFLPNDSVAFHCRWLPVPNNIYAGRKFFFGGEAQSSITNIVAEFFQKETLKVQSNEMDLAISCISR